MSESREGLPLRVLVVDDSADLAESLAATVEMLGCEARSAVGGLNALRLLEQWQPNVAFIDLTMPQMSGAQLLDQVRGQPWGQAIIAIAMTGWHGDGGRERALEDGFNDFVQKPFDVQDICAVLSLPKH